MSTNDIKTFDEEIDKWINSDRNNNKIYEEDDETEIIIKIKNKRHKKYYNNNRNGKNNFYNSKNKYSYNAKFLYRKNNYKRYIRQDVSRKDWENKVRTKNNSINCINRINRINRIDNKENVKDNRPFEYVHNKQWDKYQLWKIDHFDHDKISEDLIPVYEIYKQKYQENQDKGNRSYFHWISPAEEAFIFLTMMRDLHQKKFENNNIKKEEIFFPYDAVELKLNKENIKKEKVDDKYFIESDSDTEWNNNNKAEKISIESDELTEINNNNIANVDSEYWGEKTEWKNNTENNNTANAESDQWGDKNEWNNNNEDNNTGNNSNERGEKNEWKNNTENNNSGNNSNEWGEKNELKNNTENNNTGNNNNKINDENNNEINSENIENNINITNVVESNNQLICNKTVKISQPDCTNNIDKENDKLSTIIEEDEVEIFQNDIFKKDNSVKKVLSKNSSSKNSCLDYKSDNENYHKIKRIRKKFLKIHKRKPETNSCKELQEIEINLEELEKEKDDIIDVIDNNIPLKEDNESPHKSYPKVKKERKKRTVKVINHYLNFICDIKELNIKQDNNINNYKITKINFENIKYLLDKKQFGKARNYMINNKINVRKLEDFYIQNNNTKYNVISIEDYLPGINKDNPAYIFKFDLIFGYDKTKIRTTWSDTDKYIFVTKGFYTDMKHNIGTDISDKYITPLYKKMIYYTCIVFKIEEGVYITYVCMKFFGKYPITKNYFPEWLMLPNDDEKFYYIRSGNYGNRNIVYDNKTRYPKHENFKYTKEIDEAKVKEYSEKALYGTTI